MAVTFRSKSYHFINGSDVPTPSSVLTSAIIILHCIMGISNDFVINISLTLIFGFSILNVVLTFVTNATNYSQVSESVCENAD